MLLKLKVLNSTCFEFQRERDQDLETGHGIETGHETGIETETENEEVSHVMN